MFSPHIRWKSLAATCDSLARLLDAGVDVRRAFASVTDKTRDPRCRRALQHVSDAIDEGAGIAEALRECGDDFPPLLVDLVSVAEMSGALPEMFEHLRDHYEANLRLRRAFVGQIAWPVFQFVAAVFIVAFVILVLGWIAGRQDTLPVDVFGLGLFGERGALIWLGGVFGTLLGLFVLYQVVTRVLGGRAIVHSLLLRVPVVGHCLRSFALARFSWAFYLTQQTGMSIDNCLEASLRATNNGAFAAAAPEVIAHVRAGGELTPALDETGLFPADFIEMVRVGETTGTVPETLHRLSPRFEESARRSLSALSTTLGWLVWATVAAFILFFVFRVAMWYVSLINEAAGVL
jgi:type IV pilus assembly protein PilC